ncbi:unnamed protein product [Brachionus calyciflorus]|uniref:Tetraspanin n=1 Tax=Brachionus calyciflorus TaxID=104777 RepID=A0A814KMC4_9BILA|nr:unnamed protein product [Brachionus calyciflorus]
MGRKIVIGLNSLMMLSAGGLFAISILYEMNPEKYLFNNFDVKSTYFFDYSKVQLVSFFQMITSCFILGATLTGFISIVTDQKPGFVLFNKISIFLLIMINVGLLVFTFFRTSEITEEIEESFAQTLKDIKERDYIDEELKIKCQDLYFVSKSLECCASESAQDFTNYNNLRKYCCYDSSFEIGCRVKLNDIFSKNSLLYLKGPFFVTLFIQVVIGINIALLSCRKKK